MSSPPGGYDISRPLIPNLLTPPPLFYPQARKTGLSLKSAGKCNTLPIERWVYKMKISAFILCLMMATSIFPVAGYAADTNDAPSPAILSDRTWTIDGHSISNIHYMGIEDRNGTMCAFFTSKKGGGPIRFTLDKLSPDDIEAIKRFNPTLEPRVKITE